MDEPPAPPFSPQDVAEIKDNSRLRTPVIYEIVRREGEEELRRPAASLWWSGVAAGLSISFSPLAQAVLEQHLPDAPWRPLVAGWGYALGFLIVVLARQQLFTENTITVVLPVIAEPSRGNLLRLCRLWTIVLAANLCGTFLAAAFCALSPGMPGELHAALLALADHAIAGSPLTLGFRAVPAGFLIAAMVWMIPSAEGAKFPVVALMTYAIAVCGFAHVVAGSTEMFLAILAGQIGISQALFGFLLPVLLGNMLGGTALFALLAYAQVVHET